MKLIHVGKILTKDGTSYLFLREVQKDIYTWYKATDNNEIETPVSGKSIVEALEMARKYWKHDSFRTVNCGFRYTLPERDEHGSNALFHQMATSYSSSNGIYFDEELNHNCFINFASLEARNILRQLKNSNKL